MAEFDPEELKAAFEAGKILPSDDNLRRLDGLLRALARQYLARKVAREHGLNGKLARLVETKSFLADLWDIEALLCGFEVETPQIISRLSGAAQHGIDFLQNERDQRRLRGDDPETTLFIDLRDVYVGLTGKTGISEDGPLHRFATACTKLIDPDIVLPQAQSLRKALKRRAKAPSYFRQQQIFNNGVHSLERSHSVPAQLDEGR
jgi:hypothetical protein